MCFKKIFFIGVPHLATCIYLIIEWTRIGSMNQHWHGFNPISIKYFGWDKILTQNLFIIICQVRKSPDRTDEYWILYVSISHL